MDDGPHANDTGHFLLGEQTNVSEVSLHPCVVNQCTRTFLYQSTIISNQNQQ